MTPQEIMLGLAVFLHNLFTVVWIGGLVMISLTLLPSARDLFGKGTQTQNLMNGILQRHRIWVYISIVGLFITGVIQARVEPGFNGLMRFDTLYGTLTSIKHLLTFAMVGITLFRSLAAGKKGKDATPKQMKQSLQLIMVNTVLGVGILFLSGFMAAI
jgi:uncharacterized membrane protein